MNSDTRLNEGKSQESPAPAPEATEEQDLIEMDFSTLFDNEVSPIDEDFIW